MNSQMLDCTRNWGTRECYVGHFAHKGRERYFPGWTYNAIVKRQSISPSVSNGWKWLELLWTDEREEKIDASVKASSEETTTKVQYLNGLFPLFLSQFTLMFNETESFVSVKQKVNHVSSALSCFEKSRFLLADEQRKNKRCIWNEVRHIYLSRKTTWMTWRETLHLECIEVEESLSRKNAPTLSQDRLG